MIPEDELATLYPRSPRCKPSASCHSRTSFIVECSLFTPVSWHDDRMKSIFDFGLAAS